MAIELAAVEAVGITSAVAMMTVAKGRLLG
jgi:hypothetical protein